MKSFNKDIEIYYETWDKVEKPRAIIQIFHGMVEHIKRYEDFAKFLNEHGIIAYGMDMRGHGLTGENSEMGYFSKADGWEKVLSDQLDLYELITKQYENLPRILLGHSMGSFLSRDFINRYPEIFDAAVIMGTGKSDDPSYSMTRLMLKFFNDDKKAKLMNSLAFGAYNKTIENPKTEFDWLSTDQAQVQKYIDDKYCGFLVRNSFYKDFMYGMKSVSDKEKDIKFNKPVLFISGENDPVGVMGKSVREASKKYTKSMLKLFPEMRHEILNEQNNPDVYAYILKWINEVLDDNSIL